jgi:photosystem II stability/assembly factor-like uncharacterized protein
MGNKDEFDPRLKAYLHRGASKPPSDDLEARLIAATRRPRSSWVLQVAAAAALLVLAIGLGIAVQRARQSTGVTPTPPPFPSFKPTPYPTHAPSGASYPLLPPASIQMIDRNTGWASSSGTRHILRTTDGGSHWYDAGPSPEAVKPGSWTTFFLDANHGWLASSLHPGSTSADFSVAIYRMTDGQSWHYQVDAPVAADQGWPTSLDFVDANHGWLFINEGAAAGSQGVALYGTVDGGTTWTKLSETDPNDATGASGHLPFGCNKGVPVFLNSSTGWIAGACNAASAPFFYVTRDGGRTWNHVGIALPAGYTGGCMCGPTSLRFSDSRNGVFVLDLYGSDGQAQTYLYATHDGGASWQPGPALPANSYTVDFINATTGWTLDAKRNTILQTNDGGQHWATAGTIPSNSNGVVMDFQFVTPQVGWALGADSRGLPILKTVDGGRTWTTQLSP